MKRQKRQDAETSTLWANDPYPLGLHILARMIARSYLEEKQAEHRKKEKHSGGELIPKEVSNESWQVSNHE